MHFIHLIFQLSYRLQISLTHFGPTSTTTICLQIGDKGTILFNTPAHNQKLRINLPEWSKGLPLKAEAVDFADPFYRNGDNLKDVMWPCCLKESSLPIHRQNKISTNAIDKSQFKEAPPMKRRTDLKRAQVQLTHDGKLHRNLKPVVRKNRSFEQ